MDKKYHLLYKITNVIDNTFYIGIHSTNNLDDGYFGSGIRIKRSVNKYGKENHRFEIIEKLPSRQTLLLREFEIVDEELLRNPLCLNLCKGGYGQNKGMTFNNETKKKFSIAKTGKRNPNYGKERSEDFKRHLSEVHKGRVIDEDWKRNISEGMRIGKQKEYRIIVIDDTEYPNFTEASNGSGISKMTLWRRLKSDDPKHKKIYYKDSPK